VRLSQVLVHYWVEQRVTEVARGEGMRREGWEPITKIALLMVTFQNSLKTK